jgi:glycosyltransferase involved in cell wall biosynthesis
VTDLMKPRIAAVPADTWRPDARDAAVAAAPAPRTLRVQMLGGPVASHPSCPLVVLHVLEALGGGTARHLVDVVRHTPGVRHHVAVPGLRSWGSTDTRAAGLMEDAGATVVRIAMRRSPVHLTNAHALWRLRRLVARLRPDVVHGHSSIGGALGRAAAAGTDVARVWTPNGVITHPLALAVERRLASVTDVTIAVSASEAELLTGLGLARTDRLRVVPNGIEVDSPVGLEPIPDLRHDLRLPPGAQLVGCVGRLAPQKAPEVFVALARAVADSHPDAHFVLIGDGPQHAEIELLVGGWDRFHMIRELPEAHRVLDQFDVCVLASRYEGAPYVVLEAMRACTPLVVTDAVGSRDAVTHGVTGLVAPVDDVRALTASVSRLLDTPQYARALARAAHFRFTRDFDVARMGASLRQIYVEAVAKRQGLVAPVVPAARQPVALQLVAHGREVS